MSIWSKLFSWSPILLLALAVLSALIILLFLLFFFGRNIDENIFGRRSLIYGAGETAAAICDLKRRAYRRGFRVVVTMAAPGDTVRANHIDLMSIERTRVRVRLKEDAEDKLRYDLYYVKNHGLFPDFVIILQAVEVVLWGKGAR